MAKGWCYFSIGQLRIKIDSEDLERVSERTWRVRRRDDTDKLSIITSVRTEKGVRNVSLGQFLMKPKGDKFVYPRRYFDGLDFRKENLIVCSMRERQQMLPKKAKKNTSSRYRGVSRIKSSNRWRAGITVKGKSINLGDFDSETKAANAYNEASARYFGDKGYQNTIIRPNNRRNK
jgi:hypothetical protein